MRSPIKLQRERIVLSRLDDGSDGELQRWRLSARYLGGIMLHRHDGPDPGRDLHDHPWWFVSIILRGGYHEEHADVRVAHLGGVPRSWKAGSVHKVRLCEAHRITGLVRNPTWTLVIHGPVKRGWGFYPLEGYLPNREYYDTHAD